MDNPNFNSYYDTSYDPDPDQDPDQEVEILDLGEWTDLINVFLVYYRQHYEVPEDFNMFTNTDLNKLDSTNRQMELFYEILEEYRLAEEKDPDYNTLYELSQVDLDKIQDFHVLIIDNVPVFCCQNLIPLLKYMTDRDWLNTSWIINKIEQE